MNIIKLDAINSTNDFLKDFARNQFVENLTVVLAVDQQKGKGQRGSEWTSDPGKNLTFSVLIKDLVLDSSMIFNLNIAVTVSLYETLKELTNINIAIKWPNDIMAENSKIAGILIENVFQHTREVYSIVGVGLNVNQISFDLLNNVTSLCLLENKEFDLDSILNIFLLKLKQNISLLKNNQQNILWKIYLEKLFKKNIPTTFEDENKQKFMGIIKGVSLTGQLLVILEDDTIKKFSVKEIKMLY